jgi:hypothetical protein
MTKLFYCSITLTFLLLVACSEDEPIQANNYIDPKLIGEWFLIDTLTLNIPSPEYSFIGFQINHNNQMIPLGIENSTGRVAYLEFPKIDSLIYAFNGKMLINRFWRGGQTDTLTYTVKGDDLTLTTDYYTEVYHKTTLSSQLFDPILTDLSVKIDSVSVSNFKVYYYPSAYISKKEPSSIYLLAYISLSSRMRSSMISVEINDFNGIGEYVIHYKKAEYMIIDGDMVIGFYSDSSSTNTISIDQFDEVNKVCSGSFNFSIENHTIELTDGTFTIPIYR